MVRREKITGNRSSAKLIIISHLEDLEKVVPIILENNDLYLGNAEDSIYYQGIGYIEAIAKYALKTYSINYDRWIFDATNNLIACEQAYYLGFRNIAVTDPSMIAKLEEIGIKAYLRENLTIYSNEDVIKLSKKI